ncbi:chemotaxis protein CheW [Aromatoleum sp.]|uniref:chemotaxis protein CheW n=1 Tax=Aromatoleum sp. TaxID=2307007 RepID=UPI002FC7EF95
MTNAGIDWTRAHARLADAAQALDEHVVPSPAARGAVLEARARALAVPPPAAADASIEVLEFVLADERHAIESAWIREVVPLRELTVLPGTPAFVLGIIHLRGEILSVLDVRKFFGLARKGLTDLDKAIVLDDDKMRFGVLADRILGIRRIPVVDVQPPLPTLSVIRPDYLLGVTRGRTVILDGRKLLADPSIAVAEEVGY